MASRHGVFPRREDVRAEGPAGDPEDGCGIQVLDPRPPTGWSVPERARCAGVEPFRLSAENSPEPPTSASLPLSKIVFNSASTGRRQSLV